MKRLVFLFAALGVAAFLACSNQGEGEVCNVENGNDDCEPNLTCFPATQLNNVPSDRCCPADRASATHPACVTPVAGPGITDAQAPTDTGPATPTVTADAASDASADAGAVQ